MNFDFKWSEPQRLKPSVILRYYGAAEAAPFQNQVEIRLLTSKSWRSSFVVSACSAISAVESSH